MTVLDIIKKPFSDLKKLVIGTFLGGLPILNFFVLGFALESAKAPKKELPVFTPDIFLLGLKAKIVSLFYSLIQLFFVITFVIATGGVGVWVNALETMGTSGNIGPLMLETFGFTGFIGFILVSIFILYLSTFAVYEVAKTSSLKAGFNLPQVFSDILNKTYAFSWIKAFLLQFLAVLVLFIILTPIWQIPIVAVGALNYISTLIFWLYFGEMLPIKTKKQAAK